MNALDRLQHCPDVATLKPALQKLCEQFGDVIRLDVLTAFQDGAMQAVCFLRLDSPEKEQNLMQALNVGRFGGEVVFVVDIGAPQEGGLPEGAHPWSGNQGFEGGRDFTAPRAMGAPDAQRVH